MLRSPLQALAFGLLAGQLIQATAMPDGFLDRQRGAIDVVRKRHRIPGMSVALVDRDNVIWCQGFGQRSHRDRQPVGPGTLFSVQSVSKPITAAVVMLAAQEGLVDLDIPITRYLPDFTVNSCFEEHPERKITLRLLLAHAAGLTHEPPVGNNYDPRFPTIEAHNRSIRDTWLNSPVGSRYSYSNNGYDLAAEAVARASGLPFSEYVRSRLFLPLDMNSSTLDPGAFIGHTDRAFGHTFGLARMPDSMPFPGAGSVYTSAQDLARFVQFHLNLGYTGKRQLLQKKYLLEMYRPSITPEYGLGVAIVDQGGKLAFNHNGAGFGWQASMIWYPQYGFGCVILANKQTDADLYGIALKLLDGWIFASATCPDTMMLPFDPLALGRSLPPGSKKPLLRFGDTRFRQDWRKYEGVFRLAYGAGFTFAWYAKLAMALGYHVPKVEVRHRGAGLFFRISYGHGYGDWQRLTEHLPGLFFTEYGEALDFRNATPNYRNIILER